MEFNSFGGLEWECVVRLIRGGIWGYVWFRYVVWIRRCEICEDY